MQKQKKKKMPPKSDWFTKEMKRQLDGEDRGIIDFMMIQYHFFKELPEWINKMTDPRHISYVKYTQADYIFMGILKNICSVESMCQMEEKFRKRECINTLKLMSGDKNLDEMPNMDSLNYYLEKLSPACLSDIRKQMIKSLTRNKTFYKSKLLGKYWRVILDGTGLFCFKEKHCEHCLVTKVKTAEGKTEPRYYHKVLEAKIIFAPDLVFSLGTEFIENENETVTKQDCEINAAKRLLERIKKEYPRLPIVIQGDALYAAETVMEICRMNHWEYILTQKESRQKLLAESYELLAKADMTETVEKIGKEKGKGMYANHVEKTVEKTETANIFEYRYKTYNDDGKEVWMTFLWITSIELTRRNLEEMINAGRGRWKIENEGFNNQKNGIYDIEHLNSHDSNAMKNHYLLTQIADILMQLYLAWNPLIHTIDESIKNTSSKLLESFRQHTVTDEDVSHIKRYTTVYLY